MMSRVVSHFEFLSKKISGFNDVHIYNMTDSTDTPRLGEQIVWTESFTARSLLFVILF